MKTENLHDEIARTAYDLYENSGCIECRDLANWLDAERMVLAIHASQEIEEPEELITEEVEELERSGSERYPARREMNESEELIVIEEIEVKESISVPKRGRSVTERAGKNVPEKKGISKKQHATKAKK